MKALRLRIADALVNLSHAIASVGLGLVGLKPIMGAVAPTAAQAPAGYSGPGGVAGVHATAQLFFSNAGGVSICAGAGVPGATSMNGGAAVVGDLYIRSDGGGAGATHIYECTAAPGTWLGIA